MPQLVESSEFTDLSLLVAIKNEQPDLSSVTREPQALLAHWDLLDQVERRYSVCLLCDTLLKRYGDFRLYGRM